MVVLGFGRALNETHNTAASWCYKTKLRMVVQAKKHVNKNWMSPITRASCLLFCYYFYFI